MSRLTSALTGAVRSVNRTDSATLSAARGSLAEMLRSTPEQLSACPGIGPTKVGGREEAVPHKMGNLLPQDHGGGKWAD